MPRVCVYSYSLLESRDGKFGVVEDDGKVTGLVGELDRRVSEMRLKERNLCNSSLVQCSRN